MTGPREVVLLLLAAGANVNASASDGSTALLKATLWRRANVVRDLLEHDADAAPRTITAGTRSASRCSSTPGADGVTSTICLTPTFLSATTGSTLVARQAGR